MNVSISLVMLRSHKITSTLTDAQLLKLAQNVSIINLNKNKIVYETDSLIEYVYLLDKGSVKLGTLSTQGKVMIKDIAYEGNFFGENIFTKSSERKEFAETTSDSKIIKIPVALFQELVFENSNFTSEIMSLTIQRLQALEERLQNFVFMKAKERIVNFLYLAALRKGVAIGLQERLISYGISHRDIAYLTDTSRQTVARILNELKKDNFIHYGSRKSSKILIRDMVALQKLGWVS